MIPKSFGKRSCSNKELEQDDDSKKIILLLHLRYSFSSLDPCLATLQDSALALQWGPPGESFSAEHNPPFHQ